MTKHFTTHDMERLIGCRRQWLRFKHASGALKASICDPKRRGAKKVYSRDDLFVAATLYLIENWGAQPDAVRHAGHALYSESLNVFNSPILVVRRDSAEMVRETEAAEIAKSDSATLMVNIQQLIDRFTREMPDREDTETEHQVAERDSEVNAAAR